MTTFLPQDDLALARCFSGSPREVFRRGEAVCRDEFGSSNEVYFVASGVVHVSLLTADGAERGLFYQTAGSMLGDVSAFAGPARQRVAMRATAMTDVVRLSMNSQTFHNRCLADSTLAEAMLGWAYRKAARLIEQVEMAAFWDTSAQLAALLLAFQREMARLESAGTPAQLLDVTHQELAAATGRNRVSITNALNRIAELGAIRLGRGRIDVLDTAILEKLTDRNVPLRPHSWNVAATG